MLERAGELGLPVEPVATTQFPVESVPSPEGGLKLLQQIGGQLGAKDNAPP